ncbi:J domain-containing protein [bacterium]|nr:MAG: J domain-containing protein [bacterium]
MCEPMKPAPPVTSQSSLGIQEDCVRDSTNSPEPLLCLEKMDPYAAYWEALELEPGSDLDAVKRAYREQALTWHPDRFPYDEELRRRCEERMRHVNAAYEALRELSEGGAPAFPEETQAWRPAPEKEEAAPADETGWVERWLATPRPHRAEAPPRAVPAAPIPAWASLGNLAAALALAAAALGSLFVVPNLSWVTQGQAMRLLASPALAYAAAVTVARGVWEIALGLGLLACALNPVLPVPMSLEDWRIFNSVTPVLLAGMFYLVSKRR